MPLSNTTAALLGAFVASVVVLAVQLQGLPSRLTTEPAEPIPVAGHVEICAAGAPIVIERLTYWSLPATPRDGGRVAFAGALVGPSAPFVVQNLHALIAAPGRVTATDASGRVRLQDDDLAAATFTVRFPGAVRLNLRPTEAARARLAAEAGQAGVPALVWHRDGERVGTSKPGLPAPGAFFEIPTELRQAAVTKALVDGRPLPCPAVVAVAG